MSAHLYQLVVQFGSGKHTVNISVDRALTQTERDEIARDIAVNFADNAEPYFEQFGIKTIKN